MTQKKNLSFIKIFIFISLIIGSFLYALPNFYKKVPSVVIIPKANQEMTLTESNIQNSLNNNKVNYKFIDKDENQIQVGFKDIKDQMEGYEDIKKFIDKKNYYTNITMVSSQPEWLDKIGAKAASLGLDLMGGVHFLMEVDTKDLQEKTFIKYSKNIKNAYPNIVVDVKGNEIILSNVTAPEKDKLNNEYYSTFDIKDTDKANTFILTFKKSYLKNITDLAVKQNVLTLKNRVNELGVAEPIVQREGFDRIVIQLPGIQDTQKAKSIIGTTATLEFRAVNESGINNGDSELIDSIDGNRKILFYKDSIINGDSIIDASSGFDPQSNSPLVSVVLDSDAGHVMLDYTSKHKGSYMGSILHETVYENNKDESGKVVKTKHVNTKAINVAKIQGTFSNRFQITGLDNKEESHKLAILLRSGSLAAPVNIIEEKTIGPNMGAENIKKGTLSIVIGFFAVLIVMFSKYGKFGLVANFCVFINLLLLLSILSFVGATLTLPGIAGIILTVGMAVDANVVIFERIKEEYLRTAKVKKSIETGYAKALSSILDSNSTTLLASSILFGFGSGPIKGFAVTLSLGILTSMITSIFLSRFFMDIFFINKKTLNFKTKKEA